MSMLQKHLSKSVNIWLCFTPTDSPLHSCVVCRMQEQNLVLLCSGLQRGLINSSHMFVCMRITGILLKMRIHKLHQNPIPLKIINLGSKKHCLLNSTSTPLVLGCLGHVSQPPKELANRWADKQIQSTGPSSRNSSSVAQRWSPAAF